MNDDLDYKLYVVAELNYLSEHKDEKYPFPEDWYSSKNYYLKNKIIAEALINKQRVEETSKYKNEFLEQVRNK